MNIVGKDGAKAKVLMPLTDEEVSNLHKSAETLKAVINQLDI